MISNQEISVKPKFVRKKMEEKTELNCIKAEWAWRQEDFLLQWQSLCLLLKIGINIFWLFLLTIIKYAKI